MTEINRQRASTADKKERPNHAHHRSHAACCPHPCAGDEGDDGGAAVLAVSADGVDGGVCQSAAHRAQIARVEQGAVRNAHRHPRGGTVRGHDGHPRRPADESGRLVPKLRDRRRARGGEAERSQHLLRFWTHRSRLLAIVGEGVGRDSQGCGGEVGGVG